MSHLRADVLCAVPPVTSIGIGARIRGMFAAGRGRRVLLLLVFIWIVNVFDLAFTIMAQQIGEFEELNPLACAFVADAGHLIAFKMLLVLFASGVFLAGWRKLLTEIGCWIMCGVYTGVAFMWMEYFAIAATHFE